MNDLATTEEEEPREAGKLKVDERLEQLDREIEEAMEMLTNRQRLFAGFYASGESQEKSAIKAGYSVRTARGNSNRMLAIAGVKKVVPLLTRKYQLQHGISPDRKRELLMNIADKAGPGSVGATRLLAEIDGDIRSGGSGGDVRIVIGTSLERQPLTIEGKASPVDG